jgi:hypothetical protein
MADFNARLRAQMLRQAVLQAGDDPTLGTVAAWLPPDFFSTDTDEAAANEAELADMIAAIAAEQPTEPAQEFSADEKVPEAIRDEPAQTAAEPVKEPPTMTFAEAQDAVIAWGNKLSAARGRLIAAQSRQQNGRLKVAAAIGQLVNGLPKLSQDDLKREYLASEAERRQRVADGLEPPIGGTRQAPAGFLTAMRAGPRGNSVNRGYGNKHIKKAASLIAQQRAAGLLPAVSKVPSER